jgi:mannose-6-phosphate isomerase
VVGGSGRNGSPQLLRLARLTLDLTSRFPGDPGVLVALLLDDLDLAPGEAVYVGPGTPHAYLSGLGVEVMASSDNVLRGGMTVKHVDVAAFLDVLDVTAVGARRIGTLSRQYEGSGWQRHLTPTDAFVLDEAEVDGVLLVERSGAGPSVLLCADGEVTVRAGDGSAAALGPGGAVLLTGGLDPVEVRGRGLVLHACAGSTLAAA